MLMKQSGMHVLHLNNGKKITLVGNTRRVDGDRADETIIMGANTSRTWNVSVPEAEKYLSQSWQLVGVHIVKHIIGMFPKHVWKDTLWRNVSCRLVVYRDKFREYSDVDFDFVKQWYVRLNRPIQDIEGALDENGFVTDAFARFVCEGLWEEGLCGPTGLSSYSPTGKMCVGFRMYARNRRVIVSNTIYRDV